MSILDLFEVEEFVGRHWNRMVSGNSSFEHHADALVRLEDMRKPLAVFFRALGGDGGVELAAANQERSDHRLSFKQRLGTDRERTLRPSFDGSTLRLPSEIALFDDIRLNRQLYYWLAAYFACEPAPNRLHEARSLEDDLTLLANAHETTSLVLQRFPGLKSVWEKLAAEILRQRPQRELPKTEASVEEAVCKLLGSDKPLSKDGAVVWSAITGEGGSVTSPPHYRPFLPVPLWGDVTAPPPGSSREAVDDEDAFDEDGESASDSSDTKRKAKRRDLDQSARDDGFALHIYDKLLSVVDMLNLNRNVDDDDVDDAIKAADDLDQLTLAKHDHKPASKIRMDLDLAADEVDETRIEGDRTVPEWHYRQRRYLPDHCRVKIQTAAEESDDIWVPSETASRRIRQVKRQFEALRSRRETFRRQPDGPEVDIEEAVRARAEFKANGLCSDRLYLESRVARRDLAISVLVDVSLSTDSWMDDHRVIEVEKESLEIFAHGLQACGDDFAINTFTSRKRSYVRFERVKSFDEPLSPLVHRRIAALKPGYYTRIGAAIRVAAEELLERPNQQKLLLVLTDGKPNDVDHYEGRYGIEDARRAITEAKRSGLVVFGVTVDQKAQDYFPYIFGRGCYQIVSHADKLSTALPGIYRKLART